MSVYVLDTDILSLYWQGHPTVTSRVDACPQQSLAITVIAVEEQLSGWHSLIRAANRPAEIAHAYQRLADAVRFLTRWPIFTFTESAIATFEQLRSMRLNVRNPDLRIAAIALEHNATVVTRNLRDFQRVPNLPVENWAA
jgi:tRNA(fMet)-specific endonuclease VapC